MNKLYKILGLGTIMLGMLGVAHAQVLNPEEIQPSKSVIEASPQGISAQKLPWDVQWAHRLSIGLCAVTAIANVARTIQYFVKSKQEWNFWYKVDFSILREYDKHEMTCSQKERQDKWVEGHPRGGTTITPIPGSENALKYFANQMKLNFPKKPCEDCPDDWQSQFVNLTLNPKYFRAALQTYQGTYNGAQQWSEENIKDSHDTLSQYAACRKQNSESCVALAIDTQDYCQLWLRSVIDRDRESALSWYSQERCLHINKNFLQNKQAFNWSWKLHGVGVVVAAALGAFLYKHPPVIGENRDAADIRRKRYKSGFLMATGALMMGYSLVQAIQAKGLSWALWESSGIITVLPLGMTALLQGYTQMRTANLAEAVSRG
jgi:hypothetical protein